MKTITINNETFELRTSKYETEQMQLGKYSDSYDAIYQVYSKPSVYKVGIWHDWWQWAQDCGAVIRIGGHSCMFFSIYGIYTDEEGNKYNLYITAQHNRAYKVA